MDELDLEPTFFARCPVCAQYTFPAHPLSPCGHEARPILEPLTEAGAVYSWTITHSSGVTTPIAMTDFLGGKLRVTAPVLGVDDVAIGDRLVVLANADGAFFLVPEFRSS